MTDRNPVPPSSVALGLFTVTGAVSIDALVILGGAIAPSSETPLAMAAFVFINVMAVIVLMFHFGSSFGSRWKDARDADGTVVAVPGRPVPAAPARHPAPAPDAGGPAPAEPGAPVGDPGKPAADPAPPAIPRPGPPPAAPGPFLKLVGGWSTFGGPKDTGVKPSEGLAIIDRSDLNHGHFPGLFLATQPEDTTGLARALDAEGAHYLACRWVYSQFGANLEAAKAYLRTTKATVINRRTGAAASDVYCVDWGPGIESRAGDLSPRLARDLGLRDGDTIEIHVPLPGGVAVPQTPVPPSGAPLVLGGIIDTNHDVTPRLDALKGASIFTVFRYAALSQAASKNKTLITPTEARAIAAAGMNLGVVFEIAGTPSGAAQGARDGASMLATMLACGAPHGACAYYAVDYDPTEADMPGIIDAFTAFRAAVFPTFRVGVYASGFCNAQLLAHGLIEKRWLTQSVKFAGTQAATAAGEYDLLQGMPRTIAGLDADPDTAHTANGDIGAFIPFAQTLAAPAQASTTQPAPATSLPVPTGESHLRVMTDARTREVFGQFKYTNAANGDIVIDPAWIAANIVTVEIPQLAKFKIKTLQCHRIVAPFLVKTFEMLERDNMLGWILSFDGLWVPRHINHNAALGLSRHSDGAALDINANWNAYGTLGARRGATGSTWEIEPYFAINGFACGRWFGWPNLPHHDTDGMHLEWCGEASDGKKLV